jgi:hypothetical protein
MDMITDYDHIFSIDDDIYYPPGILEMYLNSRKKYTNQVITGTSLYPGKTVYADGMKECELLEGFSCVLYQKAHLRNFDIQELTTQPKFCQLSDDLVLSNHVIRQGYKILAFGIDNPVIAKIKPLEHGLQSDALHKGASGVTECKPEDANCNESNYNKCIKYLKEKNKYFFWFSH